jgi:hypothetical protein
LQPGLQVVLLCYSLGLKVRQPIPLVGKVPTM